MLTSLRLSVLIFGFRPNCWSYVGEVLVFFYSCLVRPHRPLFWSVPIYLYPSLLVPGSVLLGSSPVSSTYLTLSRYFISVVLIFLLVTLYGTLLTLNVPEILCGRSQISSRMWNLHKTQVMTGNVKNYYLSFIYFRFFSVVSTDLSPVFQETSF